MDFQISRKGAEPERDEKGLPFITHDYLVRLCESQGQYRTPHLNDRLYLASRGFRKIEALDAFLSIKALYLNDNLISTIENLDCLTQIRCLFLQNNHIAKIEGLEKLTALNTLNLSHNVIQKIEGLSTLVLLSNFDLSSNQLTEDCGLEELAANPLLSTLNLASNLISGGEERIIQGLKALPSLRVIYLRQNGVVAKIRNYRKRLLFELPELTYVDDRPVAKNERRLAESFILGGVDGETIEKQKIAKEERQSHRAYLSDINAARERGRQKHLIYMKTSKQDFENDIQRIDKEIIASEEILAKKEQERYEKMTVGSLTYEEDERLTNLIEQTRVQIGQLQKERKFDVEQIVLFEENILKSQNTQNYEQEDLIEKQNYQRPEVIEHKFIENELDVNFEEEKENLKQNGNKQDQMKNIQEEKPNIEIKEIQKAEENSLPQYLIDKIEEFLVANLFDFSKTASLTLEKFPDYFADGLSAEKLGKIWAQKERARNLASSVAKLEDLD